MEATILQQIQKVIEYLARGVEFAAALIIAAAAIEATVKSLMLFVQRGAPPERKNEVRLTLGRWLAVALEFELAADILTTAVTPSWNDIEKLAAIATLRTALNTSWRKRSGRNPRPSNARRKLSPWVRERVESDSRKGSMTTLLNLESHWVSIAGSLVNLVAALTIGFHAAYALLEIVLHYQSDKARLILADGVLAALAFSVVGTLLKAIALQSWSDIGMFAFVLALRTFLKQVFLHERNLVAARTPG